MNNDITAVTGKVCVAAWAPVIWGAFAAAALSIVLVILGAGLGFAVTSPWEGAGASAGALAIGSVIWMIVVQWLASGVGGYLAGRLRAPWSGIHTHEVYFRDTAHGFLAWAVATVFTATALLSVFPAAAGGMHGMASEARGMQMHRGGDGMAAIDTLLRPARADARGLDEDTRHEASGILLGSVARKGDIPAADKTYLAQVVAAQANISTDEAGTRIDETVTSLRESADTARRNAAELSIFMALSMLIGAFVASAAAAYGGVHRDCLQNKI